MLQLQFRKKHLQNLLIGIQGMLSTEQDYHLRRELSIQALMILWMFRNLSI